MRTAPKKARSPKRLLDLAQDDCRWPIGEPRHPDFHFCGDQQAAGRPYCALHWSMAFQPARPRHQGQRQHDSAAAQPLAVLPPAAAKAA